MSYIRVKICGITRPQDAQLAAELGADAIGLNFISGPRQIEIEQAAKIVQNLPPFVHVVALIGSQVTCDSMAKIFKQSHQLEHLELLDRIDYFQVYRSPQSWSAFSGHEFRRGGENAFWPVVHVTGREFAKDVRRAVDELKEESEFPCAVLLDTATAQLGGSGKTFNWNWIAEARAANELNGLPPIILAGGLTPDNVADAIRIAQPYAVDVSSGVEIPNKPGIKDPIKMRDFIQAAKGTI
ncbi:MAG: phosphoribosylanthranilate isomerase [Phycisphaerales bacterium]|nr:phosphoribosylanthranilate isomerase [Phycisphaerales bacterium]